MKHRLIIQARHNVFLWWRPSTWLPKLIREFTAEDGEKEAEWNHVDVIIDGKRWGAFADGFKPRTPPISEDSCKVRHAFFVPKFEVTDKDIAEMKVAAAALLFVKAKYDYWNTLVAQPVWILSGRKINIFRNTPAAVMCSEAIARILNFYFDGFFDNPEQVQPDDFSRDKRFKEVSRSSL